MEVWIDVDQIKSCKMESNSFKSDLLQLSAHRQCLTIYYYISTAKLYRTSKEKLVK